MRLWVKAVRVAWLIFSTQPRCWFGHDIDSGRWVSPRVKRVRCVGCGREFARVESDLMGVPRGTLLDWDADLETFYKERIWH